METPGSTAGEEKGGEPSNEQGPGKAVARPGDRAKSAEAANEPGSKEQGEGDRGQSPAGDQKADGPSKSDQQASKDGTSSGQAGSAKGSPQKTPPGGPQSGNPETGGGSGETKVPDHPPEEVHNEPDAPNLQYARKQTTMALEHLDHEAGKQDSQVLRTLGWTKDEAERFARNLREKMKAADQATPQNPAQSKNSTIFCGALASAPTRRGFAAVKRRPTACQT